LHNSAATDCKAIAGAGGDAKGVPTAGDPAQGALAAGFNAWAALENPANGSFSGFVLPWPSASTPLSLSWLHVRILHPHKMTIVPDSPDGFTKSNTTATG
jgi:hypothetical protein